jgi:hypothetical protein
MGVIRHASYASIYPAVTTSGQRTGTFILHRIANPGPLEQQGIPLHEAANHAGVTNAWYREDVRHKERETKVPAHNATSSSPVIDRNNRGTKS